MPLYVFTLAGTKTEIQGWRARPCAGLKAYWKFKESLILIQILQTLHTSTVLLYVCVWICLSFVQVKRTPSVRGMPISPPQLNFSTNSTPQDKMTNVGVGARPLPAPPGESFFHIYRPQTKLREGNVLYSCFVCIWSSLPSHNAIGQADPIPGDMVNKRAVRILLECILVKKENPN